MYLFNDSSVLRLDPPEEPCGIMKKNKQRPSSKFAFLFLISAMILALTSVTY